MTMWQSVMVCCGVLAAVSGLTITGPEVSQCVANPGALPLAARVAGCSAVPCALPQQEDAVIDIAFRAPRDITTMTTSATVYLSLMGMPIPIPYDLAEKSVTCNYLLNSSCPVTEGDILQYSLKMYIDPAFPVGLAANIEVSIFDDSHVAVACLRVPIVIVSPRA